MNVMPSQIIDIQTERPFRVVRKPVSPITSTICKRRQGRDYVYDPVSKLFKNPESDKWVQNPANRRKTVESRKSVFHHPEVIAIIRAKITHNTSLIESIQYVLKVIKSTHANQVLKIWNKHKAVDPNSVYAWCPHELYECLLGRNYSLIMAKLVEAGILAFKPDYGIYKDYRTYRLAEQFRSGVSLRPVTCMAVDKKIGNYCEYLARKNDDPVAIKIGQHLANSFPKIDVTKAQFNALWKLRYDANLAEKPDKMMPWAQYEKIGEYPWELIEKWNDSDLEEKFVKCTADEFSGRIHHIFTKLPAEIRARLFDKSGRRVNFYEYDLVNAQPTIFANLLITHHNLKAVDHPFIQMVGENRIYEDLMGVWNIDRNDAKKRMMVYLYGEPDKHPQKEFEMLYGEPAVIARRYKVLENDDKGLPILPDDRYKYLPKMMQKSERKMFGDVWKMLFGGGYQFIPVHDAVYIAGLTDEGSEQIKAMIEAELKKHLTIEFEIKKKRISEGILSAEEYQDNDVDYSGLMEGNEFCYSVYDGIDN